MTKSAEEEMLKATEGDEGGGHPFASVTQHGVIMRTLPIVKKVKCI